MVGAREREARVVDLHRALRVDRPPVERVAPRPDERTEARIRTLRCEDRQAGALEAVVPEHVQAVDVGAVIGVLVRDHDRVDLRRVEVIVQHAERAVAAVHP